MHGTARSAASRLRGVCGPGLALCYPIQGLTASQRHYVLISCVVKRTPRGHVSQP